MVPERPRKIPSVLRGESFSFNRILAKRRVLIGTRQYMRLETMAVVN